MNENYGRESKLMLRAFSKIWTHQGNVMGWSHRKIGLTYLDPDRALPGYTLFAPNGGEKARLARS